MTAIVNEIEALYTSHGHHTYGENVTLLEHSLLTAGAAEAAGAADSLVVACLLHDIGHLLGPPDSEHGVNHHGDLAGDFLARHFPDDVSEPARLHIEAKRYLCALEPDYHATLSSASQQTLSKQGGPMTPEECRQFEAKPYATDAVRLRRWEDSSGKLVGAAPLPWSHFRRRLEEAVAP